MHSMDASIVYANNSDISGNSCDAAVVANSERCSVVVRNKFLRVMERTYASLHQKRINSAAVNRISALLTILILWNAVGICLCVGKLFFYFFYFIYIHHESTLCILGRIEIP